MTKFPTERNLAGAAYSGDFPGLGTDPRDIGYLHGTGTGTASDHAQEPIPDYQGVSVPPPDRVSGVPPMRLTVRVENIARTIGTQIFGKW